MLRILSVKSWTRAQRKFNEMWHRNFSLSNFVDLNKQNDEKLESRRREIMARGLPKRKPIKGVKHVIVVASGKGGVGKSTTAVNLSVAMKVFNPESSVGLLDADVFGPSIPLMMNVSQSPEVNEENIMEPLMNYGIKCMSMGFLIDKSSPVVWRGLMVMNAIDKLLRQVTWDPLDYLFVDTPPGTGDTHLSLIQNIPVSGVILVTTPQQAALNVTKRGANMFKHLNIPIIGIVENMNNIVCPNCDSKISLFGSGTETVAKELGVPILQSIPLSADIAESCDMGKPIVLLAPRSTQADAYRNLAERVTSFVANQS